ncbi:MAG: type II CAAX prenyl endopeptidase Rce1 family protein [Promethearchaeota archaeon]
MSSDSNLITQKSLGDSKPILLAIIAFYSLSFFAHWFIILLYFWIPFEPLQILSAWTPNIAVLLVVYFILRDKEGLKNLFLGWKKYQLSPIWLLIGFSPAIISVLIILVYYFFGGAPSQVEINWFYIIFMILIALITGATGEELGWRGFLQPHLQQKYSPLVSSIIVGLAWGLWHLPLWLTGIWTDTNLVLYLIKIIAYSIVIGWAFNNTNQSLFLASMFHYFINVSILSIDLGLITLEAYSMISPIIYSLYAISIVGTSLFIKKTNFITGKG